MERARKKRRNPKKNTFKPRQWFTRNQKTTNQPYDRERSTPHQLPKKMPGKEKKSRGTIRPQFGRRGPIHTKNLGCRKKVRTQGAGLGEVENFFVGGPQGGQGKKKGKARAQTFRRTNIGRKEGGRGHGQPSTARGDLKKIGGQSGGHTRQRMPCQGLETFKGNGTVRIQLKDPQKKLVGNSGDKRKNPNPNKPYISGRRSRQNKYMVEPKIRLRQCTPPGNLQ